MGVNILLTGLLIVIVTFLDFFIETTDQGDKKENVVKFEKTLHYKITNFLFKLGYLIVIFSLLYLIWEN